MLDARDQIVVAVAHGPGAHVCRVGAATRLGQREGRQPFPAGAARQPLFALRLVAADENGIRAQIVSTDHGRGRGAGARDGDQRHQHGGGGDARPAKAFRQIHAHHAQRGQAGHMARGGKGFLVHGLGHGGQGFLGKACNGIGNGLIFFGRAQTNQ